VTGAPGGARRLDVCNRRRRRWAAPVGRGGARPATRLTLWPRRHEEHRASWPLRIRCPDAGTAGGRGAFPAAGGRGASLAPGGHGSAGDGGRRSRCDALAIVRASRASPSAARAWAVGPAVTTCAAPAELLRGRSSRRGARAVMRQRVTHAKEGRSARAPLCASTRAQEARKL